MKAPKCACGCGGDVKWNEWKNRWNTYINHHQMIGRKRSKETGRKISASNKGRTSPFKGKKHTKETKKRLSESHKGIKMPEHVRKLLSEVNTGSKRTKETKLKMSEAAQGKRKSKEHVLKISLSRMKCRTDGYCDQWTDKEYKKDIKQEDCSHCGLTQEQSVVKYGRGLYLHHKDEDKTHCHPNNIDTLCCSCHCIEHWRLGSYD